MIIKLRAPATSANLGPGFDVLGIALNSYNYFQFEAISAGVEITGCEAAYATQDNLAVQAWRSVEKRIGAVPSGLRMHIDAQVPIARGLGSSATLLAAGAMAANRNYGDSLTKAELLDIVTALEGHPDNVAPALLGGLRASMMADGRVFCMEYPVHPSVSFCALIPDFQTSTHEARGVLPASVPFADAVFNLSRLAITLRALETADFAALGAALDDRLHQPFRKSLICEYDHVRRAALECGASAFCISGSGSTLMSILPEEKLSAFADAMQQKLASSAHAWRVCPLSVDPHGTQIIE